MRKKTIIWFLSLFALLLSVGVGHRSVICFGVKSYLESRLPKGGEVTFTCASSKWKEGKFVLHDVMLERDGGKESLPFHVKIEDIKIDFNFQLFPFKFSPKVVMDRPLVALKSSSFGRKKKGKGLYHILEKAFFKAPLKVKEGKFILGDKVAYVTFQGPEEKAKGILTVGKEEGTPLLTATFSKEKNVLDFDLAFESLDAIWAFEVARFFLPELDKKLVVKGGELSGTLLLALSSPHHIEHVEYAFDLSDFRVGHGRYGFEMGIHHLKWKEHFTSNHEMGTLESHPFFEKMWPYFVGDGEVSGMHVEFDDPHTQDVWAAADVNGTFRFSRVNHPLMEFHGVFHRGGKELPFHLIGEGKIEEEALWKMAFVTHLFGEEEESAHFALTSRGDKRYLVNVAYENLGPDQIGLFKSFSEEKIPFLKGLHIEEGRFSGRGEGWIEDKVLKRCVFNHFEGKNVVALLPNDHLIMEAKSLHGKGEIDLSTPDFFDGTFWEMEVTNASLDFGEGQKAKGVELSVAMHDEYLKPSTLTFSYEGIEGKLDFEGLYTHLNIHAAVDLLDVAILDLEMKLKTQKDRLEAKGNLAFLGDQEKKDRIDFGAEWDLPRFLKGEILSGLELGWFKGEEISAKTLNLPLEFWGKEFRGKGMVGIEGTFNSHALELSIDPTHLKYESKEIDIEPQSKGGAKVPNCTFFFDFETKEWRGKIPLKEARVKEHSFGIEFESVSSEVDLEGSEFLFQNVDAFSGGVRFQAEIAVNFEKEDRSELKIDTYAIDGDVENVAKFLKHFETFQEFDFPLKGKMTSGPGEMHLRAYVGEVEELLEWKIALHLQEGSYPFSETLGFENLAGHFYYCAEDQLFKVEEMEGSLHLTAGEMAKSYELNVPLLELDAIDGILKYDCRLEAPTYEICRAVGSGVMEEGEFAIYFDTEKTRIFGAHIDVNHLTFKEGSLSRADLSTTLSVLDLVHHLDFLSAAGIVPIKEETLYEMRGPLVEGEASVNLQYSREDETLSFEVTSSKLLMGAIDLDHLSIRGEKKGDHFSLKEFDAGPLKGKVTMEREGTLWKTSLFEVAWKKSYLKGGGTFDERTKTLHIPLEGLRLDLEEMTSFLPYRDFDWSYLTGTLFADGTIDFDFSNGFRKWGIDAKIKLVGEDFGRGKLRLESPELLYISIDPFSGFRMSQADFNFLHPRSNQLWAKCHVDMLTIREGTVSGENGRVIIPPEMVHFLGQTHSLPYLDYVEERAIIYGFPLRWDNQIEATFDFSIGETSSAEGSLKEGYYWIGDEAWYLSGCSFAFDNGSLSLSANTLFEEIPFDLRANLSFYPYFISRFTLFETTSKEKSNSSLVIQTDWNDNEGFFVQSIEGEMCGLDFTFHHSPKDSFLDQMALKGTLKINTPKLSKILPLRTQETLEAFEIGKGYELSGDLVISKTDFEKSHFTGFLKGKNFELMGSTMETLMSEIDIRPGHIELDHFTISDVSGMFTLDHVRLVEQDSKEWELIIPEVMITDFRPSLLKKIGRYPSRIKPFTIRNLTATNIRGTLGDTSSFKGKGNLNFINTFKRDYHLLDIPFEILGRLGLDMGLLVPVRGDLDFFIDEGRIYLTELSGSYSEGKRSQFFLSPTEHSFVDFQGNIDVNIKMKQYVLLKVTEPFTLSIGGTFEKPKYGLH